MNAKVMFAYGLGSIGQQINLWMADAGWQSSAMRQADLDKVERVVMVAVAAERDRCANVVRYWLAGQKPEPELYEARCVAHIQDGRSAPKQ